MVFHLWPHMWLGGECRVTETVPVAGDSGLAAGLGFTEMAILTGSHVTCHCQPLHCLPVTAHQGPGLFKLIERLWNILVHT